MTIDGLRFTDFTALSPADYMTLEVDNDDVVTAIDDKLITIIANANPRLSSATNQVFVVGSPPTPVVTLTITESAYLESITKNDELRVRIPTGFNTTWDPGITTVTVGGSAAGKVLTTLRAYEDGNKTAVIDVDDDFVAGEEVTIVGLQFETFNTVSAAANLELEVFDDDVVSDFDDKTVEIIADAVARIVSEADQLFWESAPPTLTEAFYITDASVASITATNDLRIRVPASLDMAWDSTVTSVSVTGTGAAKVGTAVSYEDADKTLVLDVTSSFAGRGVHSCERRRAHRFFRISHRLPRARGGGRRYS